jgi:hypothetical protein
MQCHTLGMDVRLVEAIERWLKFPRVVLLYLPLPFIPAVPMFIADSGNPARAFGWTFWLWLPLILFSGIVAGLLAVFVENKYGEEVFFPAFHTGFIIAWLAACCALFLFR